jgi:hypothetical protein
LLCVVYVACWIFFGLTTFRKGHYWLFWIGFFIPNPVDHRRVHQAHCARRRKSRKRGPGGG